MHLSATVSEWRGASSRADSGFREQVTFTCEFAIAWDKAPNVFGVKNIVVDSTAALNIDGADWNSSLGSAGEHLLSIAIHQRVVDVADLAGLPIGEPFKLSHLIRRRTLTKFGDPTPAAVDDMCVASPYSNPCINSHVHHSGCCASHDGV